uniref:Uncharacterized protein n=1 Tax=Phaeomonas parva TaxID=124430 RepID=A0A7S1XM78_9STRA
MTPTPAGIVRRSTWVKSSGSMSVALSEDDASDVLRVHVHLYGRIVTVCCGLGTQRIRWLAQVRTHPSLGRRHQSIHGNNDSAVFHQVAIARWDYEGSRGWFQLGVPVGPAVRIDGTELTFGMAIKDVLANDDHITFRTSLSPVTTGAL